MRTLPGIRHCCISNDGNLYRRKVRHDQAGAHPGRESTGGAAARLRYRVVRSDSGGQHRSAAGGAHVQSAVWRNARPGRAGVTVQGSTADDGTDLEAMIPASPDCSPHAVFAKKERAEILGAEVERLPEKYRNIVRLRY